MHIDARELRDDSLVEGDLCIIGAGAAGIAIALEWLHSGKRVILLEGGGFNLEPDMQDLYRGEITGRPYYPLQAARLHYFGGTTGHWAGFCAPLDPIDFQRRAWVPHSGWPLTLKELHPYYQRAQHLVELGPYKYDAAYWEARDPETVRLPYEQRVLTKMWQFSPPTRFGSRYRETLIRSPEVHLYTYANVCEIEANESISAIAQLHVRMRDGKRLRFRAHQYILACGSIQNARLLLASNRQMNTGLGNGHDRVGRYFMEHIEMPVAELALQRPWPLKMYLLDYGRTRARGELVLSREIQRQYRLLNGTFSLAPGAAGDHLRGTFQEFPADQLLRYSDQPEPVTSTQTAAIDNALTSPPEPPPLPAPPSPYQRFKLACRHEQSPNPDSRVSLAADRDALGMPRASLHWRLTALDKQSIQKSCEVLARETGRNRIGRVRLLEWLSDNDWPAFLSGGWHHMGTTRMHEDPRQGVVDAHCRVHGLANLHVAGASVFPTAGAANPTLSLIALSLRLSDHLKEL